MHSMSCCSDEFQIKSCYNNNIQPKKKNKQLLNQNFHLVLASTQIRKFIQQQQIELSKNRENQQEQKHKSRAGVSKRSSLPFHVPWPRMTHKHMNQIINKRCNNGKYSVRSAYFHIMEVLIDNTHLKEEGGLEISLEFRDSKPCKKVSMESCVKYYLYERD